MYVAASCSFISIRLANHIALSDGVIRYVTLCYAYESKNHLRITRPLSCTAIK